MNMNDGIFIKKCLLRTADIKISACIENNNYNLCALVTRSGDLTLCKTTEPESRVTLRWIPWFDDISKKIQTVTFSPEFGEWLLITCCDNSLYLLCLNNFLDLNISNNLFGNTFLKDDFIFLPNIPILTNDKISAVAWYSNVFHDDEIRHISFFGTKSGQVVLLTLPDMSFIMVSKIFGEVINFDVCEQQTHICIIITNESGQQWKMLLSDISNNKSSCSETKESVSCSLKNISYDTFLNIRQKLIEKKSKLKSLDSVNYDNSQIIQCKKNLRFGVTLVPVLDKCVRAYKKTLSYVIPENILMIENYINSTKSSHKVCSAYSAICITDSVVISCNEIGNEIYILSLKLCECKLHNIKLAPQLMNSEFNEDALLGIFKFEKDEVVQKIYCVNRLKHRCLIFTNVGVYIIYIKSELKSIVLQHILRDEKLQLAEKYCNIFSLDVQNLIFEAANIKLKRGEIYEGWKLCSLLKGGSLKVGLMLAALGLIDETLTSLLKFNYSGGNKLHISNLKMLTFVHQLLISYSEKLHDEFLHFITYSCYDNALLVSVLTQAGLYKDLSYVTKLKGIEVVTVSAIANVIQYNFSSILRYNGFWEMMSDSSLFEALFSQPKISKVHIKLIESELANLDETILYRLEELYNPFRICSEPWKIYSYKEDFHISNWINIYLQICLYLSSKTQQINLKLIDFVSHDIKYINQFDITNVQLIGAGFSHTCVIFEDIVYSWGETSFGALGIGPTNTKTSAPCFIDLFPKIGLKVYWISCGNSHTLALTNNSVYAWGNNKYGQIGINGVQQSWFPQLIPFFQNINVILISTGQYHSLAIDDQNRVYSWGWGVHGQLGHGNIDDSEQPKIIQCLSDKKIIWACGGHAHSLFLDAKGSVWACGSSMFGQLGTGSNSKSCVPMKVLGISEKILSVSTNYFHNIALTDTGRLYQWGSSPNILRIAAQSAKKKWRCQEPAVNDNEVHLEDNLSYLIPTLVDTSHVSGEIIKISCGSEHNALLVDSGIVYTWGRNVDGQLGNSIPQTQRRGQHVLHPTPVSIGSTIVDVECGSDYTVAVDSNKKVWIWGALHSQGVHAALDNEMIIFKEQTRVIKLPNSGICTESTPSIISLPIQHTLLPKTCQLIKLPKCIDTWEKRFHFCIEKCSKFYNSKILIKSISVNAFSAGAKIAKVNGDLETSLSVLIKGANNSEDIQFVIRHFLMLQTNSEHNLISLLKTMLDSGIDIPLLENVLSEQLDSISSPLSQLILNNVEMHKNFDHFTTKFCFQLISHLLKKDDEKIDCILPRIDNFRDTIDAINMSDNYLDIVLM